MNKMKMFVVCHKPYDVPSNDVYIPIHVGKAISSVSMDMIGDDTGDNISEKNQTYCELTAVYWMWKNVKDCEYIGLSHYRRFFNYTFTNENTESLFSDGTDVLMVEPIMRLQGLQHKILVYVCSEDMAILHSAVRKICPEYEQTMMDVLLGTEDYCFNMLVCRKKLFDDYCEWLFSILDECEKHIKLSPYTRGRRVFGYLAEFLMQIYFKKNHHKIRNIQYILRTEKGDVLKPIDKRKKVIARLINVAIPFISKKPFIYDESVINGLKVDGVKL